MLALSPTFISTWVPLLLLWAYFSSVIEVEEVFVIAIVELSVEEVFEIAVVELSFILVIVLTKGIESLPMTVVLFVNGSMSNGLVEFSIVWFPSWVEFSKLEITSTVLESIFNGPSVTLPFDKSVEVALVSEMASTDDAVPLTSTFLSTGSVVVVVLTIAMGSTTKVGGLSYANVTLSRAGSNNAINRVAFFIFKRDLNSR